MNEARQIRWSQHNVIILIKTTIWGVDYTLELLKYFFTLFIWSIIRVLCIRCGYSQFIKEEPGLSEVTAFFQSPCSHSQTEMGCDPCLLAMTGHILYCESLIFCMLQYKGCWTWWKHRAMTPLWRWVRYQWGFHMENKYWLEVWPSVGDQEKGWSSRSQEACKSVRRVRFCKSSVMAGKLGTWEQLPKMRP